MGGVGLLEVVARPKLVDAWSEVPGGPESCVLGPWQWGRLGSGDILQGQPWPRFVVASFDRRNEGYFFRTAGCGMQILD